MWLEFWKLLIPAGSASFLLSVMGALQVTIQHYSRWNFHLRATEY